MEDFEETWPRFGTFDHHNCRCVIIPKTTKPKGKSEMKIENVAIIANDNVTTVKCSFSWSKEQGQAAKAFTFKILKTLAETIKPVDSLVADSKNGLSVVTVISVDEFADVEPDSDIDYRWAFLAIDVSEIERLKNEEVVVITSLKKARQRNLQKQYIATIGLEDEIAKLNHTTV